MSFGPKGGRRLELSKWIEGGEGKPFLHPDRPARTRAPPRPAGPLKYLDDICLWTTFIGVPHSLLTRGRSTCGVTSRSSVTHLSLRPLCLATKATDVANHDVS